MNGQHQSTSSVAVVGGGSIGTALAGDAIRALMARPLRSERER